LLTQCVIVDYTSTVKTNTAQTSTNPRLLLQRELERRCSENPRYSLRAFAKALKLSPTVLSLVLSGKRPLSRQAALRAADALSLSPEECAALLEWSRIKPSHRAAMTTGKSEQLSDSIGLETDALQMSLDSFALISEWYHYAILSLLEVPGSRFEAKWISQHLGINEMEAKAAMDRLERMGVVDQVGGRWKQVVPSIRIGNNVPTGATKKFQKQLLLKAVESIENEPGETRDFSSMTMAMDPSLIPYARERIRKFRRELSEELEAMGAPKRVYNLTVQIFPVSRSVEDHGNMKKEKSR
jgi:uncharacterized protein (TIGR02147 family)